MSPAARFSLIASSVVLAIGLAVFATAITLTQRPSAPPQSGGLGGPFQLTDQDGRRVDQSVLADRTTLLFFGFTHCPDVCPTKLFEITQALQRLGRDADRVRVVFVSVDPERDTPDLLKAYLGSFDARYVGLTGTLEEVAAVTRAWRAYARKVPLEGGGYTVDHTAAVYLIDRQGRFLSTLDVSDPERAAAQLRARL
jgi:protein SCO1/2